MNNATNKAKSGYCQVCLRNRNEVVEGPHGRMVCTWVCIPWFEANAKARDSK